VDFQSDFFRGRAVNADVIAGGLKAEEARIRDMGYDFEYLLIDARAGAEAASAAAHAALAARPVDVDALGGGVRLDPAQTPMLEALVNAVIEAAPRARVALSFTQPSPRNWLGSSPARLTRSRRPSSKAIAQMADHSVERPTDAVQFRQAAL
jgi:hypothetical protein